MEKKPNRPGRKPMTGARSFGKPGQKPKPNPRPKPAEQAEQPLGLPVKSAGELPTARPTRRPGGLKPLRKPGGKPGGKPAGKPAGRPVGKPGGRPVGRPVGKLVAKRAPAAPQSALAAPKPDPLVAAKQAWQPAVRWCQKELGNTTYTDQDVIAAVKRFQERVQAVLEAPDAAAFQEAQHLAADSVRTHAFLRWAPVPAKLPQV